MLPDPAVRRRHTDHEASRQDPPQIAQRALAVSARCESAAARAFPLKQSLTKRILRPAVAYPTSSGRVAGRTPPAEPSGTIL